MAANATGSWRIIASANDVMRSPRSLLCCCFGDELRNSRLLHSFNFFFCYSLLSFAFLARFWMVALVKHSCLSERFLFSSAFCISLPREQIGFRFREQTPRCKRGRQKSTWRISVHSLRVRNRGRNERMKEARKERTGLSRVGRTKWEN